MQNPYCAYCSIMIFPYEERISVVNKGKEYHVSCFDKQVAKEVWEKGGKRAK